MRSTTTPRAVGTGTIVRNPCTIGATRSVTAITKGHATARATVFVTGGTTSIGTAVATVLANSGDQTAITIKTASEIALGAGIQGLAAEGASTNSDPQHRRGGVSAEPQTLSETDLGIWDLARAGVPAQL